LESSLEGLLAAVGGDAIALFCDYNYFILGSRYYLKKVITLLFSGIANQ
jgi:hypothetical protein